MHHKTKLLEFVIILMAFFFLSGCDPDSDDDNEGGAPFEIDDILIKGTGCWYEDTYKVELNSNDEGDTITVEFSAFDAATDEEHRSTSSYCGISIPIKVPAGMSVGLAGMDHEGAAYIPSGGTGKLNWEQFFSTDLEPTYDSFITTYDEYHEFSYKNTAPVLWSECGSGKISPVSFETSISASKGLNSSVQAQEHVSKIKLHLKWKECE